MSLRITLLAPFLAACLIGCENLNHGRSAVWVRSDQSVQPEAAEYRSTLSARDLARIEGYYDDVFNLRDRPTGRYWRVSLTYEEVGRPSKPMWTGSVVGSLPVVAISRHESGGEHYWLGFSYDAARKPFTQVTLSPPSAKYDYRWYTSGYLGAGRWVVRRWTDDPQSTSDPSDLRFKGRIVLEIVDLPN
jgi:hypothetical protein